jgi:hypothetical protein
MAKGISMLLILVVLAAVALRSQQSSAQQPAQSHVVPLKEFAAGQTFETVSGDPQKRASSLSFGFTAKQDTSSCRTPIP